MSNVIRTTLVALAVAAASVAFSPAAHAATAGEIAFLKDLESAGVHASNTDDAIASGHSICTQLSAGVSTGALEMQVYGSSHQSQGNGVTAYQATQIVRYAVRDICTGGAAT
ncbi:MAG TPA: DUF732 domain-containing protein [Mycobacterium sp.]|nr:DUF732 domain-containing protein [Mycobacterium sp.]